MGALRDIQDRRMNALMQCDSILQEINRSMIRWGSELPLSEQHMVRLGFIRREIDRIEEYQRQATEEDAA